MSCEKIGSQDIKTMASEIKCTAWIISCLDTSFECNAFFVHVDRVITLFDFSSTKLFFIGVGSSMGVLTTVMWQHSFCLTCQRKHLQPSSQMFSCVNSVLGLFATRKNSKPEILGCK